MGLSSQPWGIPSPSSSATGRELQTAGPNDSVNSYFECITSCSLDDGECVTRCVEVLREQQ